MSCRMKLNESFPALIAGAIAGYDKVIRVSVDCAVDSAFGVSVSRRRKLDTQRKIKMNAADRIWPAPIRILA
eukprot:scaffold384898_cov86-Cyclotella_meneghiniana.AAC.2